MYIVNQFCSFATKFKEHFHAFKFNKGRCNFTKHVADQGHSFSPVGGTVAVISQIKACKHMGVLR